MITQNVSVKIDAAAIVHSVPGVGVTCRETEFGTEILWPEGYAVPSDTALADMANSYAIHTKVLAVKAQAAARILAVAPEWKQLNLIRDGDPDGLFPQIDAIRAASNILEAAVTDGSFTGAPADWAGWPA